MDTNQLLNALVAGATIVGTETVKEATKDAYRALKNFDIDQVTGSDEQWRNEVIQIAKKRLSNAGRCLRARDFASYAPIFVPA